MGEGHDIITTYLHVPFPPLSVWQYGEIDFVLFILCDLLWTPHSGMWS